MNFEWDEDKRQANIHNHGIDFVDVVHIFDHDAFTMQDTRFEYDEPRYWAFGMLGMKAILVVYTYRDNDVIRIVSARKATRYEQKQFFS
jgi:uncharacterized DUF497 family protein